MQHSSTIVCNWCFLFLAVQSQSWATCSSWGSSWTRNVSHHLGTWTACLKPDSGPSGRKCAYIELFPVLGVCSSKDGDQNVPFKNVPLGTDIQSHSGSHSFSHYITACQAILISSSSVRQRRHFGDDKMSIRSFLVLFCMDPGLQTYCRCFWCSSWVSPSCWVMWLAAVLFLACSRMHSAHTCVHKHAYTKPRMERSSVHMKPRWRWRDFPLCWMAVADNEAASSSADRSKWEMFPARVDLINCQIAKPRLFLTTAAVHCGNKLHLWRQLFQMIKYD